MRALKSKVSCAVELKLATFDMQEPARLSRPEPKVKEEARAPLTSELVCNHNHDLTTPHTPHTYKRLTNKSAMVWQHWHDVIGLPSTVS